MAPERPVPLFVAVALLLGAGCGSVPAVGTSTLSPVQAVPTPATVICPNPAYPSGVGVLTYIKDRNVVLMFGGDDASNTPIAETWMLSAGCWQKLNPTVSPSARDSMTAAYDPGRKVVILYGGRVGGPGQSGSFLYDTWTWDGQAWANVATPAGPVLLVPTAAYDPRSKQVILSGSSPQGEAQTWAWTGLTWQLLQPTASPPPRFGGSLAFDSATGALLMFGGSQTLREVGDTWIWDGSTWRQLLPSASPSPRFLVALGPNRSTPGLVLFGGANRTFPLRETWTWNGNTWTQVHPVHTPPSGVGVGVVTDTELQLVGQSEVWTWSGADWYRIA